MVNKEFVLIEMVNKEVVSFEIVQSFEQWQEFVTSQLWHRPNFIMWPSTWVYKWYDYRTIRLSKWIIYRAKLNNRQFPLCASICNHVHCIINYCMPRVLIEYYIFKLQVLTEYFRHLRCFKPPLCSLRRTVSGFVWCAVSFSIHFVVLRKGFSHQDMDLWCLRIYLIRLVSVLSSS